MPTKTPSAAAKAVEAEPKIMAYLRVSTDSQDCASQENVILRYARDNGLHIPDENFIRVEMSSRRTMQERKIDVLMDRLNPGDTLIVSELSRLGRSSAQIVMLVDQILKERRVNIILVKPKTIILHAGDEQDMLTEILVMMFSLMASVEREFIRERTKAGIARARAEGKRLGRPRGWSKSKLDARTDEIVGYLKKGISKSSIAKLIDCAESTLHAWIKSRRITA